MVLWAFVAVSYCVRTIKMWTAFYKVASDDPVHTKLVLPILEKTTKVGAADDLDKALSDMLSHNTTQMMKVVPTLQASNATKRGQVLAAPPVLDSQHSTTAGTLELDQILFLRMAPVGSTLSVVPGAVIRDIRAPFCALRNGKRRGVG